jgi:hypothetical protein
MKQSDLSILTETLNNKNVLEHLDHEYPFVIEQAINYLNFVMNC